MTKIVIENSRAIPLLSEHFANLCWVCKAAAKAPDIREYVKQKIHAQDGILCATDGHRLHLYLQDLDSLPESVCVPDGLWEIKSKNGKLIVLERVDNEELVFPNYWNVFSPKALQIGRYDARDATDKDAHDVSLGEFLYHAHVNTGMYFNHGYITEAFIPGYELTIEKHGKAMLVLGNDKILAAVMGLAWKDSRFRKAA